MRETGETGEGGEERGGIGEGERGWGRNTILFPEPCASHQLHPSVKKSSVAALLHQNLLNYFPTEQKSSLSTTWIRALLTALT